VRAYTPATVAAQVDKMRADIRKNGECVVGCEELTLLCHAIVSGSDRIKGLEQIAQWEGWTFEVLPDDEVRFCNRT
jgi:hypothetical protein